MDRTIKTRDYGFDNIKFILIILVVLGHILEEISTTGFMGVIRSVIYSFHMPFFIFLSGFVVSYITPRKLIKKLVGYLIPFFIIGSLFSLYKSANWYEWLFMANKNYFWYLLILSYCLILTCSLNWIVDKLSSRNEALTVMMGGGNNCLPFYY